MFNGVQDFEDSSPMLPGKRKGSKNSQLSLVFSPNSESEDAFYAMLSDEEKSALAANANVTSFMSGSTKGAGAQSSSTSTAGGSPDPKISDIPEKERVQRLQDDMLQMQVN